MDEKKTFKVVLPSGDVKVWEFDIKTKPSEGLNQKAGIGNLFFKFGKIAGKIIGLFFYWLGHGFVLMFKKILKAISVFAILIKKVVKRIYRKMEFHGFLRVFLNFFVLFILGLVSFCYWKWLVPWILSVEEIAYRHSATVYFIYLGVCLLVTLVWLFRNLNSKKRSEITVLYLALILIVIAIAMSGFFAFLAISFSIYIFENVVLSAIVHGILLLLAMIFGIREAEWLKPDKKEQLVMIDRNLIGLKRFASDSLRKLERIEKERSKK